MSSVRKLALLLCGVAGCSSLSPEPRHPIEGTYDVTMSFVVRYYHSDLVCTPISPGGLICVDSTPFTRVGVLSVSDASASSGQATFVAEMTIDEAHYLSSTAPQFVPNVQASGQFDIPLLDLIAGDAMENYMVIEGLQEGVGHLTGTIGLSHPPYISSSGTFTAQRR